LWTVLRAVAREALPEGATDFEEKSPARARGAAAPRGRVLTASQGNLALVRPRECRRLPLDEERLRPPELASPIEAAAHGGVARVGGRRRGDARKWKRCRQRLSAPRGGAEGEGAARRAHEGKARRGSEYSAELGSVNGTRGSRICLRRQESGGCSPTPRRLGNAACRGVSLYTSGSVRAALRSAGR
jgi:hypothetical protein